ncbi:MAG: ATP-binding protein [Actinomycetota bacterium]
MSSGASTYWSDRRVAPGSARMGESEQLGPSTTAAARAAGLRRRSKLTLSEVDRRRTQLWSASLFVVLAVTVAITGLMVGSDVMPEPLRLENLNSWVLIVLGVGLAMAFVIYVVEKERNLRKLGALLIEERVLSIGLSNRLSELSALGEVAKALNASLELDDVFPMILTTALDHHEASEGSIMLLSDDKAYLEVVSTHGVMAETVSRAKIPIGEGIAGTVAASRTPMIIQGEDLPADLEGKGHPERRIHSSMCVPLVRRDELLGVLSLNETAGERQFSDHDLVSLRLFADHAAIAIGNAGLFAQERETIAQLEELDRLKSDFVATVSHELKTPLTAIIGSAKTVMRRGADMEAEQHQSFMEMIERQGNRLLRLIDDVLTAARIESGLPHIRRQKIDLKKLSEIIIEDLTHTKQGTDRRIHVVTAPDEPTVWGDPTSISQILLNLVENALKYSDEDVTITLKELAKEAVIEVSDKGDGISDEQLKTIFDRFRQVDSSSTRSTGGFGLGLYIVKNLVEAHRGKIEVHSDHGKGSTFTVRLPKRAEDH